MALADSKYKDSFIAQDELDRLLDEARSAPLSQDEPGRGDDEAIITQEDIDALLNLGRSAMDEPAPEASNDDDLVSQEDIDALLSSHKPAKKKKTPEPEPVYDADDGLADLDLVSPEDIRKLLLSEEVGETGADREESPDSITDEDIKALISGTDLESESRSSDDSDSDSDLITQDDIDALLAGVDKDVKKKPGKSAEAPAPMADTGTVDNIINPADIDSLLNGTGESAGPSASKAEEGGEESNLISQDDIDKLLMGKYQEPEEEEETTLIDQEDIDRLLSSARPFSEEGPAKSQEPDKLISQEDIDRLLQEDDREKEKTDDDLHDQVILEKLDKLDIDEVEAPQKTKEKKEKKPFPKKKVMIGLAVACLLAAVGAGSFYVYRLKTGDVQSTVRDTAEKGQGQDIQHAEGHGESDIPILETYTVTMNDFVAVAPALGKGSSYISLSLTFQIAETPENPVKEYEPFFRNIVYEVMNKVLTSQGETAVVEADLKTMIMDALNGALAQGTVSTLEFIDFETG